MEARQQVTPSSKRSADLIRRYGMAMIVTGLTLLVALALRQVLDDAVPLVLFILAVMVSAWYGGLGPGVLSSVLSVLAGNYFLMEPARSFSLSSPTDWLRVGAFLVTAGVVSSLSEAMHEARRQAELQAREAERRRRELEHAMAARAQSEAERERLLGQLEAELAERRVLEESLRCQTEALQQADRRKDEFLSMLSHELRNPLAPIYNAVRILAVRGHQPEEVKRLREMIERQLGQLVRLVDDLLDISRITRGKIQLRKAPVDLAQAVSMAVEISRPLMEERGHELTVTLPETPLRVYADAMRLAQVLSNLLNNAAKYTETPGRIDLIAEQIEGEVCLRVRDTGIGIAPEMLPRVFDLFLQAESSPDRSQGGLGVGLTLVRQLVELHGGTVEARSKGLGRGTEMVARLPALPEAMLADVPDSSGGSGSQSQLPESEAGERLKILVVDDNKDSAESLATLLMLSGHEARTAFDGLSALEEAQTFLPDVMLLDIGLPKLDGYEVAHRLREGPERHRMLLLAMTGYGQEEDRRRTRDAGFDHHLVKPVDLDKLRELLLSVRR